MDRFNSLPEEITLDIISRLPPELVLECKLVCTNWRSLVRHPSFSKMHLNHPASDSGKMSFIALTEIDWSKNMNFQYFEYDENHESIDRIRRFNFNSPFGWSTIFLGSTNGLICLYQDIYPSPGKTYICNPITREYIMLPEIKGLGNRVMNGFGYVSSTNEFKVVRIMFERDTKSMEVYIYTLGNGNGWRNIGNFDFGTGGCYSEGIFVNGVLYWLDDEMIVSFDLAEEKFYEHLPLPPSPPSRPEYNSKLWVLDGCLSFAIYGLVNEAECWDVWLLKNKDDNHCTIEREGHQSLGWSKVCRVFHSEIFAITKSYYVLTYKGNRINIHDLEALASKTIVVFKEHFHEVFCHKNTLVSLKELGEEDTKIIESVEMEVTESNDQPFNQL